METREIPEANLVFIFEYQVGGLAGIFLGASLLTVYDDLFRCYDRTKRIRAIKDKAKSFKLDFSV